MNKPFLVGIAGGSASGKTLFVQMLKECFTKDKVCFISQDEYYHKKTLQPKDHKGIANFDTPDSIDFRSLRADLEKIKKGIRVQRKEYTFNNPNLKPGIITYTPAPVVIVEGIFILHFPEIVEQLNLKVFIEAGELVRMKRRIQRDRIDRGYDLEDVLYRFEHHVAPSHERFIEPSKQIADIIVPNNFHFHNALEVLTVFIKSKI